MKKLFLITGLIVMALFLFKRYANLRIRTAKVVEQQQLPAFKFYRPDSSVYTLQSVPAERPVCVVYFDPDCDFCEGQITAMMRNKAQLKNFELLFVSASAVEKIREFADKWKIAEARNMQVLWDKDLQFPLLFDNVPTPSTFIYDKEHRLLKVYKGIVQLSAIVKWI